MATLSRHPLASRILPMQSPSTQSTKTSRSGSITKRPRSPDPILDSRSKRVKAAFQPAVAPTAVPVPDDDRLLEKDERRAQREAQKEEFRSKYRRAFPTWVFYFDADVPAASADSLGIEIEGLGAVRACLVESLYLALIIFNSGLRTFFLLKLPTLSPMPHYPRMQRIRRTYPSFAPLSLGQLLFSKAP
jgi:hypothetical protein